MQTQNKKNGRIFQLNVFNYQGAEAVEIDMSDLKPKILSGPNGQGKSSTIKALYEALGGSRMRPEKIDNPVGPYADPSKKVKKAVVKIGIEGDPGILEFNGHSLERFYVNFSVTENGNVNLSVTDDKTGTVHKSAPREKIKNLLGLFLDPLEMVKTLEEPNGDRKLAENLCEMVGYNPKPFIEKEEALFEEKQEENRTLKTLQGQFELLDVPQDDWEKKHVDPAEISAELQRHNEYITKEEVKKRAVDDSKKSLQLSVDENTKLENEIIASESNVATIMHQVDENKKNLEERQSGLSSFKIKNKAEEWDGTEDIEGKISKLTTELTLFREHEKAEQKKRDDIAGKSKEIELENERLLAAVKDSEEKQKLVSEKKTGKVEHDKTLESKKLAVDQAITGNKPEEWTGEKDPEGVKTPLQYLSEKMATVESKNKQVKDRENYIQAEEGIKLVKKSIKDIDEKRKQNQKDKAAVIAQVKEKFPHPGITVDYKKPFDPEDEDSKQDITVWVDFNDGKGKRTINDISEGQKLFICTHILIAGNTGPLNVIVVRSGHSLDEDNQKIIFNVAMEHGYSVILETIVSTYKGAFNIKDGNVASINMEGREITGEEKEVTAGEPKFNW